MQKILERIKTNFKKNKILILIFLVVWLITVFVTLNVYSNTLGKKSQGNGYFNDVILLHPNDEIIQTMDVVDSADNISFMPVLYTKNGSSIEVEVRGTDSNYEYAKKTYSESDIVNNSYHTIALNQELSTKKDKKIELIIKSNENTNENIAIRYLTSNVFENDTLKINGLENSGTLVIKQLYKNNVYDCFSNIIISILVFGISAIMVMLFLLDVKKEILFVSIVAVFGLIFMTIITPISGPDEEYHYRQVLINTNKIMGYENPETIEDVYVGYYNFSSDYNVGCAYESIINNFNKPLPQLDSRRTIPINQGTVYSYSLCYLPQIIGVLVGRILGFNFLKTYYLGRLLNLVLYAICVYVVIKKTPVLKTLFGVVASLPIFLQQAICYSQDSWIFALSMLLFAYFLKWYFSEEKIDYKEYLFVLIVDILLAPAKSIYSLFMLLYIMIPIDRYKDKRTKIVLTSILLIPTVYEVGSNVLSRILPILFTKVYADGPLVTEYHVDKYYSIRYIIANPIKTIKLVLNTFKVYAKDWVFNAIGGGLSGLSLMLPVNLVKMILALLIATPFIKENSFLNGNCKILIIIICICIVGFTMITMLVGWTDTNSPTIMGIQGRYFSPFLVYILSILNNKRISLPKKSENIIIFIDLLLLFEVVIYVMSYTFIN